eukprot:784401-Prorocentrum_minimum.AAC.1
MASKAEVWAVISDYENLPAFLPNLLLTERVVPAEGAALDKGAVRLRQVGGQGGPHRGSTRGPLGVHRGSTGGPQGVH